MAGLGMMGGGLAGGKGRVASIGFGVALIVIGVELIGWETLAGVVAIGVGVAVGMTGVAAIVAREVLLGVAVIGVGVAVSGFGVVAIGRPTVVSRIRRLVDWATKPPPIREDHESPEPNTERAS